MSPSLINARTSILSLLLLGSVSATAITCPLNTSVPAGLTCGVRGLINTSDYYIEDLFVETTPESCAAACFKRPACKSFSIQEGSFCELQSGSALQVGFVPHPNSWYTEYDIGCFSCVEDVPTPTPSPSPSTTSSESTTPSTTTTESSSTTEASTTTSESTTESSSSATTTPAPSPTAAQCPVKVTLPEGSVCGTVGVINDFSYYIIDLYEPKYLTPEGCALKCFETADCLSFNLNEESTGGFCELQKAMQETIGFAPDSTSYYTGWNLGCFDCQAAPVVTSSTTTTESTTTMSSTVSVPFPAGNITIPAGTGTGTAVSTTSSFSSTTSVSVPYPAGNTTSHAGTGTGTGVSSSTTPTLTSTSHSSSTTSLSTSEGVISSTGLPTTKAPVLSTTGSVTQFTTSTVYATQTYTITSCPPIVTKCPYGSVTTVTIAISTTICPVTATGGAAPNPTGGVKPPGHGGVIEQNASSSASAVASASGVVGGVKPTHVTGIIESSMSALASSASAASVKAALTTPVVGGIATSTVSAGGVKATSTSTGTVAPISSAPLGVTGSGSRIGGMGGVVVFVMGVLGVVMVV